MTQFIRYNDTEHISIGNLINYNQCVRQVFFTPKWALRIAFQLLKLIYLQNITFRLTQPLHQDKMSDQLHFILEVTILEQINRVRFNGYLPLRIHSDHAAPRFLTTSLILSTMLNNKYTQETIWQIPKSVPMPTFYNGESLYTNDYDYVYKENGKYLGKWDYEKQAINMTIPEEKYTDF
jgi:hypothetical protein